MLPHGCIYVLYHYMFLLRVYVIIRTPRPIVETYTTERVRFPKYSDSGVNVVDMSGSHFIGSLSS